MSFTDAVRSVVTVNYANFRGRASRSEFWYWVLFDLLVGLVVSAVRAASPGLGTALSSIWFFATVVPYVAVGVRRLHDTGRSGWWYLLAFPGVFLVVPLIVAIVFWSRDSEAANAYGPPPADRLDAGSQSGAYPPPAV